MNGFVLASYALTAAALLGYGVSIWLRLRAAPDAAPPTRVPEEDV